MKASKLTAAENKARDAAKTVLWEVLSDPAVGSRAVIEEAIAAAVQAGLDAISEKDQDLTNAVAERLDGLTERLRKDLEPRMLPLTDSLLISSAMDSDARKCRDSDVVSEVMRAFRKRVDSALHKHYPSPVGPIWEAVEKASDLLRMKLDRATTNPERVGGHGLRFLKAEVSREKKKHLSRAPEVPIADAGARIDRQVKDRLREGRKRGAVISRKRPGQKEFFWGLKEWENDEERWERSSPNVLVDEIAGKLPEFGGRAKTTGIIDYSRCDSYFIETLRAYGYWLPTSHLCHIVRIKTIPPTTRVGGVGEIEDWDDECSVEDLADPCSLLSARKLEQCDAIDKQPMSEDVRQYWRASMKYLDDYERGIEELRSKGWDSDKIRECKRELLRVAGLTGTGNSE